MTKKVTRRAFLAGVGMTTAGLMVLNGCGDTGGSGKTLTIRLPAGRPETEFL